jgi:hypothetical protein
MIYTVGLLLIAAYFAATISGLVTIKIKDERAFGKVVYSYTCCDTGDGAACVPRDDRPKLQFKGQTYALLKSSIYPVKQSEQFDHLEPTDAILPGFGRVFINSANKHDSKSPSAECQEETKKDYDWIKGPRPFGNDNDSKNGDDDKGKKGDKKGEGEDEKNHGCYAIPKQLVIYVCREDNKPGECDKKQIKTDDVVFDAYVREKDVRPGGKPGKMPDIIAYCDKPKIENVEETEIVLDLPNYPSPGKERLQLETFWLKRGIPKVRWLSPYCKPAIYLYPEQKTDVHVAVAPKGPMTLTIPAYPPNGWSVTAEPNGNIYHKNKLFDYLYWEAQIPDDLIAVPRTGLVVKQAELKHELEILLPKLGLNKKETSQFITYWMHTLPASRYYFVGIVPTETINAIAPLAITPKPDTLLRVTLYFQALENPVSVTPPILPLVTRTGFTAVEWGGIYKNEANETFSCVM